MIRTAALAVTGMLALLSACSGEVNVEAQAWSQPESIGHAYPYSAPGGSTIQTAVSKNGTALVVWADVADSEQPRTQHVAARRFDPETGWGAEAELHSGVALEDPPRLSVDLAMNASGAAIAAWPYLDGTNTAVMASRFTPGAGWATAQTVVSSSLPGAAQGNVRVAMSDDGTAFLVSDLVLGLPATDARVWASLQMPGDAWSVPQTIDLGPGAFADVAADPAGNAIAIWRNSRSHEIGTARFEPASGWSPSDVIRGSAGRSTRAADAFAAGGDGSFVLVLGDQGLWSQRYSPGSGWENAWPLDSHENGVQITSSLSINASGTALVSYAYYEEQASTTLREPGGDWGNPELLSKGGLDPASALADDGSAIAIWVGDDASSNEALWTSRRAPGAKWEAPVKLPPASIGGNAPMIGLDRDGNAIAVWMDLDGNVFASRWVQ